MKRLRVLSCVLSAMATLGLVGCGEEKGVQPGPAELALVTEQLDQQLNASLVQLQRKLVEANRDKRIYVEELTLSGKDETIPSDWWIYDNGLMKIGGVDTYHAGYFALTPKGEAFANGAPPHWLAASFQGKPQVVCASRQSWASCKVSAIATVQRAREAPDFFSLRSPIAQQTFAADLEFGPSGWQVSEFTPAPGQDPTQTALTAIFGDDARIAKARNAFAMKVNRQVR